MCDTELIEKIENSIAIGNKHIKRMNYAFIYVKDIFPLSIEKYKMIDENQITFIDQFIFRFSKLQDEIGNKLFRFILIYLDENIEHLPFRDILGKLEKIKIINSRDEWLKLKEIRNDLAHEYPDNEMQQIEALNTIIEQRKILFEIFENCNKTYTIT